jgi:glycosyltransferase involved in cell wall biosynthesis
MKVMFVCTTGGSGRRQLGGAERFLVEMLPALAARGVDVVACTPRDEVAEVLRERGITWIELGAEQRVDLGYARQIGRLVDQAEPDVVSAHLLSAAMHCRAALGLRRRNTPLVVTLHNSLWQYRDTAGSWKGKATVQVNITLDLILRRIRPHATVAVSGFEAGDLRNRGRVANVHVIPNPLPADWPTTPPVPGRDADRRPRVGFLGRMERDKGADLLHDVAALLPDLDFWIAGTGTVPAPRLPNVEPVGRVDAAGFLRDLDCLLAPSRVESFGRSVLEAMSLGVPVVHSGAGGLAELTSRADGVLGFRADLSPDSLASTIRKVTDGGSDLEERLALANSYLREYAFDRSVDAWSTMYRAVAHDAR